MALSALEAGKEALGQYSCPKSPHKFTQPQLFAMLVLKQFFKLDYRGAVTWLSRWKELRDAIGLQRVPHYSTLCYAAGRLLEGGGSLRSPTRHSCGSFDGYVVSAGAFGLVERGIGTTQYIRSVLILIS